MPSPEVMKFMDGMQDMHNQIPSQLDVHSNSNNGTVENGIRRRPSDPTNNSSVKTPEVIDLDEEDSPPKQDPAFKTQTVNGVNTTVKKVSWPWPVKSMGGADKIPSESTGEVPSNTTIDKEGTVLKEGQLSPADTMDSQGVVGGRKSKNHKRLANEHPRVVQFLSKDDNKDVNSVKVTKKRISGSIVTPSPYQGERKRPIVTGPEDCEVKRPKTDTTSNMCITKVVPKEMKVERKPEPDTKGSSVVSVVDLVEDDDEIDQGTSVTVTQLKSSSKSESVKGAQTAANDSSTVKSRNDSKLSVTPVEKNKSSTSIVPMVTTRALVNVQSSSNSSEEKKTRSISSLKSPTQNGLIPQLPSIEVKKVKLCPQLEKQATAMSAVTSLTVTPSVVTPKLASGASLAQTPVSMTASVPETTEMPSLVSSKSPESVKESLKEEEVLTGYELESKKGLNPIHSETRKIIKKLTRPELEAYFFEMACKLILSQSDAGKYRQLYEEMKESNDSKALKISQLHKQVADLSSVVHKAISDSKERNFTIPAKTTRSVGLQLDPSNITHAYRIKSREEKIQNNAQPNSTSSNHPSGVERSQLTKLVRPLPTSNPKSSHPTPNGLVTGAIARDTPPGVPSPTKSPQRQLRALHPRVAQPAGPSPAPVPSSTPTQSNPDPSRKNPGFIDIAEEAKILNNAIAMRRPRGGGGSVLIPNSSAVNVSLSSAGATSVKVISSPQLTQAATLSSSSYPQPGAQTRVVTATTIPVPAGTPVTTSRLTYIIPTQTASPVQQRQLLLASTGPQSQQGRGRPSSSSLQAVLMRPTTALVQVPAAAIASNPPPLMRAIPSASTQSMMGSSKISPQQQASRVLSMPNRPSPPARIAVQHPAPLPAQPQPTVVNSNLKPIPRRPVLKLSKVANGIVLSWNMTLTTPHEEIASYQLYAYQEGANAPPSPSLWKKVGDVKALPLPMACTLTQFADGHTYHFAVRAVDVHGRVGEFSMPGTIELFN